MTRILPPAEWHRLDGTEAGRLTLPVSARVVVVESNGAIVGCHVLTPILHAECLWVHPDHRGKTSVPRRLWAAVQRAVRQEFGVEWFWTAAVSDDVKRLLAHVKAEAIPGTAYMVKVGGA